MRGLLGQLTDNETQRQQALVDVARLDQTRSGRARLHRTFGAGQIDQIQVAGVHDALLLVGLIGAQR